MQNATIQLLIIETREIENDLWKQWVFFFLRIINWILDLSHIKDSCLFLNNISSAYAKMYETNLVLTKDVAGIIKMNILLRTKYLTLVIEVINEIKGTFTIVINKWIYSKSSQNECKGGWRKFILYFFWSIQLLSFNVSNSFNFP